MSSHRNVRVDFFDAQWYLYQCVWGVTKFNFLLSFLLRVAVREQACKRNPCSPCHKGRDAVLALRKACWQHLLFRLWSLLLVQNSRCCRNRNLIKKALSDSAISCLSQQHSIRTVLCEVLRSTWHDRVSARKRLPLTNEQLSQTKRVRKITRRKQVTSPQLILVIQSGFLMVAIFMRSCAMDLWWIREKVEKDS